ncbi:MAG: hypothetical protein E6J90_43685 [Deltaproteobacteria bacterium]|nr:MAG: hypothetical protein E6J90_43685 [Deltaproteobacteria bacterium]
MWIVGEGNNELGAGDGHGKRHRGVLEALLARMCDRGWGCSGKLPWNAIRKFRAGAARLADPGHGDYLNVLGLVLAAHEDAADAVAFARDVDSDPDREEAVTAALAWIRDHSGWLVEVIGGVAKPALEGWILALRAVPGTDAMSRSRTKAHLAEHQIAFKSTAHYTEIVEQAELGVAPHFGLPPGAESLRAWLSTAHEVLHRLVHGERPHPG